MISSGEVFIIIVAAGSGSRFGADLPKQFLPLCGRPLLMTTIDRMRLCVPEATQLVVLSEDFVDYWHELCENHDFQSPEIVVGGKTRWESVKNALAYLPDGCVAFVHDGARPLVDKGVVEGLINAVTAGHQGALPVVPLVDSIRLLTADGSQAVERSNYMAVQTPQAFDSTLLKLAYTRPYSPSFTDDASVMEAAGYSDLALVPGHAETFKITLPRDLALAQIVYDNHHDGSTQSY